MMLGLSPMDAIIVSVCPPPLLHAGPWEGFGKMVTYIEGGGRGPRLRHTEHVFGGDPLLVGLASLNCLCVVLSVVAGNWGDA